MHQQSGREGEKQDMPDKTPDTAAPASTPVKHAGQMPVKRAAEPPGQRVLLRERPGAGHTGAAQAARAVRVAVDTNLKDVWPSLSDPQRTALFPPPPTSQQPAKITPRVHQAEGNPPHPLPPPPKNATPSPPKTQPRTPKHPPPKSVLYIDMYVHHPPFPSVRRRTIPDPQARPPKTR